MNRELELARQIIETTGTNLFLTGRAGTGKTTFLRQLADNCSKRMVVLAPTGIAAINASGMTIHSFFQLPFAPYIPGSAFRSDARYKFNFTRNKLKIIRSLDLLVIDEISMVRADLLDAVDDALRRARKSLRPFGGVQLLLIGDIHQLPPVTKEADWELLRDHYASPYFFSSNALSMTPYCCIELQHIYRQQDDGFIEILNSVRDNRCTPAILERLNSRYIPGFDPDDSEGYIRLFTHNRQAAALNALKLDRIDRKEHVFTSETEGDFPENSWPADHELRLKEGAQVMFIKNDPEPSKAYVNGTIATVISLSDSVIKARITSSGETVEVQKAEWTNARYVLNSTTGEIEEQIIGTFRQYPLRLAWGITIHKSQGLTFDKAIISAGAAFSHGQTYVALSRCRTLEGLVLSEPIPPSAIISDVTVDAFNRNLRESSPDENAVSAMAREYLISCLDELFGFGDIAAAVQSLRSVVGKHLFPQYEEFFDKCAECIRYLNEETAPVSQRFAAQYRRLAGSPQLEQRIRAGAEYFTGCLDKAEAMLGTGRPATDNKAVAARLDGRLDDVDYLLALKRALLEYAAKEEFSIKGFLSKKAAIASGQDKQAAGRTVRKASRSGGRGNAKVFEALMAWREAKAQAEGRRPSSVLKRRSAEAVSEHLPHNEKELLEIEGIGPKTLEAYGAEILDIVFGYRQMG